MRRRSAPGRTGRRTTSAVRPGRYARVPQRPGEAEHYVDGVHLYPARADPRPHHSLRSGGPAAPLRAFGAGRVAAAGLFARALIARLVALTAMCAHRSRTDEL